MVCAVVWKTAVRYAHLQGKVAQVASKRGRHDRVSPEGKGYSCHGVVCGLDAGRVQWPAVPLRSVSCQSRCAVHARAVDRRRSGATENACTARAAPIDSSRGAVAELGCACAPVYGRITLRRTEACMYA